MRPSTSLDGVILRDAQLSDLDAVVDFDSRCFARPWQRAQWAAEVERPAARVRLATSSGGGLVGLSCTASVLDEWELHRIAVDPELRGRGLGRDLLNDVLSGARAGAASVVWLEVASRNSAARALYAAAGFVDAGLRPGYYADPPDDAVILRQSPV